MPTAHLTDRAVVSVAGEGARAFLERLVTCDLDRVAPGRPRFGALLSPQGKIGADFLLHETPDGFLLDVAGRVGDDLVRRLTLYRLRAPLTIAPRPELAVRVGWDDASMPSGALAAAADPRAPGLGWRALVVGAPDAGDAGGGDDEAAYHAHRVGTGVPELGRDAPFGELFPHEALMDGLAGVDFDKGCYVGQEVVSRMQHRGTARTRFLRVRYDGAAPVVGTPVTAGDRALGTTGTSAGGASGAVGLALLRVDRAADAVAAGVPVLAGPATLRFDKPGWVRFPYPDERAAAPAA